jgi:hypothetical protein
MFTLQCGINNEAFELFLGSIYMNAILLKALLMFSLCSIAFIGSAEVLNASNPITPQNIVKKMGAGVDATWSEVPNKINNYTAQATAAFANKGFRHIRLRVANDDVIKIWEFLDKQIQDALDNGMIPIIANQSHTFEDNPTQENQAAWVAWWGDMAKHYKDYPYELMFDLIVEIASSSPLSNEPIDQLNEAYEQAVNAIRNSGGNNNERIIIFSAHKRSDPKRMHQLDIPSQGNGYLIGEFHEGYASGPSKDPANPHYYWNGTKEEIKLMSDRADAAMAWSNDTGIPIWEGAWMPGNYNKGNDYDIERQIQFSKYFIGILNDRGIPHAINATKKFYDVETNTWTDLAPIVDKIISFTPSATNSENGEENNNGTNDPTENSDGNTKSSGSLSYDFLLFLLIMLFIHRDFCTNTRKYHLSSVISFAQCLRSVAI